MSYFPFFIDLEGKEGLIAGGGAVALRKIEKLQPYAPRLTVAAPHIQKEIRRIPGLTLLQAPFTEALLTNKYFVIAATDDPALNHRISLLCQQKNILVNTVDSKEDCTFIFPCLIKKGKLSIGISTEGASPNAAIHIKNQIIPQIPDNFDTILDFLESKRQQIKTSIPNEKQRSLFFAKILKQCIEKGSAITEEEFQYQLKMELH